MNKHVTYRYGGKAASLLLLREAGFNVPPFIILTEKTQREITNEKLQKWVDHELQGEYFAVRSSANLEDGDEYSFAGVFTTKLFVAKKDLLEAVKKVATAKNSTKVQSYINLNKLDSRDLRLSIIIQQMIAADVSGVAFSCDPLKPYKKSAVISSVFGLGEALVNGSLNADYFTSTASDWKSKVAVKEKKLIYDSSDLIYSDLEEELKNASSLNHEQLNEVKSTLDRLEHLHSAPQDVEFCYAQNQLYILQSRPITTIDPNAEHIIWDNSNIIESYPGITSPFTFSFIVAIYESVYKNFAKLLGVSSKQIEANKEVFAEMLGHINGRVYYHLIHWYKALAMLPAYQLNAQYMEKMMGVSEPLGVDFQLKAQPGKWKSIYQLAKTVVKIVRLNYRLPKIKKSFSLKVNDVVKSYKTIDYGKREVQDVWKDYHEFKSLLVNQWSPPLANDLLAMIYFGTLQKLCANWLNLPQLHTQLVVGKHPVKSVLPAQLLSQICETATQEGVMQSITESSEEDTWGKVRANQLGETGKLIWKYIENYGDRSIGELKLENETFTQNPLAFITILKTYKFSPPVDKMPNNDSAATYVDSLPFFRRVIFNHVSRKAAELVSDRENLRFDRTLAFGIIRKFMWEIGHKLQAIGKLHHFKDIFYLKESEIDEFIHGSVNTEHINAIIKQRKLENEQFWAMPTPPERIHQYNGNLDLELEQVILDGNLTGIPCCAGIVEGRVRILSKPEDVKSLEGDILVTSSTDPGWITIFQSASAILVERGSTLSHAAIVSREMGIPCIVGIKGLTQILKNGDRVKMNGLTGVVERMDG
ncbi:MAG: hypothetical protein RLZZ337_767 [Bacteroidota bacterium]|jgi:pyruvate,water dikinase